MSHNLSLARRISGTEDSALYLSLFHLRRFPVMEGILTQPFTFRYSICEDFPSWKGSYSAHYISLFRLRRFPVMEGILTRKVSAWSLFCFGSLSWWRWLHLSEKTGGTVTVFFLIFVSIAERGAQRRYFRAGARRRHLESTSTMK